MTTSNIGIGCGWMTVLLGAAITGCASHNGEAEDPSRALEPRDTALEHEACDLEDGDAKRRDADGDGTPEIIQVLDGGQEVCRAVDMNSDGTIDMFRYFDESGQERRRESGFDRDALPDEISVLKGGVVVQKMRETNNDRKIDTWDYFEGGRLVRSERDSTGDGFVDQWWTYDDPDNLDCAVVTIDENGDGEPEPDTAIDMCEDEQAAESKTAEDAGEADAETDENADGEASEDAGDADDAPPERTDEGPAADSPTASEPGPGSDVAGAPEAATEETP